MQQSSLLTERLDRDHLLVVFSGPWVLGQDLPELTPVRYELESGDPVSQISFDTGELTTWDTGFLVVLLNLVQLCRSHGVQINADDLPEGARRLIRLARAVPASDTERDKVEDTSVLAQVGAASINLVTSFRETLTFLGESALSFLHLLQGKARFPFRDFLLILQDSGLNALPIVSAINFLVGVILGFIGAVTLEQFGAQIYVANLVAIAMTREMAAMMTGIIMAGRTGAAFAAQLGTMTVNEEIDALKTMGISPMEYLVLPRELALILMMPLLTLYGNFMGILGGALVGLGMFGMSFREYIEQTRGAVSPEAFALGLIKASVYGLLVALTGCYWGMKSGRSASAVGAAVTTAVVTGILAIIVASAVLTIIYTILGV